MTNRRRLLHLAGAASLAPLAAACTTPNKPSPPNVSRAGGESIVVVGGGFAGASCARALKQLNPTLAVTLVEPQKTYTACPLSNLVIGGTRQLQQQQFTYHSLAATGVQVVPTSVVRIDAAQQQVRLATGATLNYQKLVMAPGIQINYNAMPGYTRAASKSLPHAWQAGEQTQHLRQQLQAMPNGGLVVISIPAAPYRCPPGPYERASLIAHYLQQHKPRSKVLLLDAKDNFSKQTLFAQAWRKLYGSMVEWQGAADGAAVVRVDSTTKTFHTDFESVTASVGNLIPPQQAGAIAQQSGLADASGWCPVDAASFESRLQPNIHVIGDAAIANAMPKSAFAANAQARLCAIQVQRNLQGLPYLSTKLANTCYSLVAPNYGISVAGVYQPQGSRWQSIQGAGGTSPTVATQKVRQQEALQAKSWFQHLTRQVFGA